MQYKGRKQQEVIHVIIPAKTFPPEENRIHRAYTINRDGQQKTMTVGEPGHVDRLIAATDGASGKSIVMERKGVEAQKESYLNVGCLPLILSDVLF
jgi:hypothetical protein